MKDILGLCESLMVANFGIFLSQVADGPCKVLPLDRCLNDLRPALTTHTFVSGCDCVQHQWYQQHMAWHAASWLSGFFFRTSVTAAVLDVHMHGGESAPLFPVSGFRV